MHKLEVQIVIQNPRLRLIDVSCEDKRMIPKKLTCKWILEEFSYRFYENPPPIATYVI